MDSEFHMERAHVLSYKNLPINVQVQSSNINEDYVSNGNIIIPTADGMKYCFTPHTHDAIEIIYILEGETVISIGTNQYNAKKGELFIANPYELHSAYLTDEYPFVRYVYITVPLHELLTNPAPQIQAPINDLLEAKKRCVSMIPESQLTAEISAIMLEMANMFPHQKLDSEAEFALIGMMYMIMSKFIGASLIENTPPSERKAALFVRKVSMFIENNYMTEITSQMIRDTFSYHPDYFSRLFSSLFGKPFRMYLTEYRIRRAVDLFNSSEKMSMRKVAASVGFTDYCYFSHMFKQHIGITPREFVNR